MQPQKPPLRIIETPHPGQADLGTGVSAAIMRRVARGELPATARLHRTAPILAFGRLDKLRPGYRRAVAIARERGYEPIERLAGGRAAVFHEGTLSFSLSTREPGAYAGTRPRFEAMANLLADALSRLGIDGRVGEVPGEYCPGEFSVNAAGRVKIAGIGQRVITGGAHLGSVTVIRGASRIRDVLIPVYEALEIDWDPATTGSVAAELGEEDGTLPLDRDDPLLDRAAAMIRAALGERYELAEAELDERTRRWAEELRGDHAAAP